MIHSARAHLITFAKRHPGVWREADAIRARMADTWPSWCYLPVPGWAVAVGGGKAAPITDSVAALGAGIAAAIGAWRLTQGIYRYDSVLYSALVATPMDRAIPVDVLYRLPEWCVYIETPGLTYSAEGTPLPVAGAWLHLDYGHKTGLTKLRAVLDAGHDNLIPIGCPLVGTLAESLDAALATSALHLGTHGQAMPDMHAAADSIGEVLQKLVSLALYLCAEDAEIGDGTARPAMPRPKRTKQGWRLFAAAQPTTWDVGVRLGAALRASHPTNQDGDGTHAGPRPHVRRAHWHTFLVGQGRTERRIKWLPPIPVNVGDVDDLPATVRPVK